MYHNAINASGMSSPVLIWLDNPGRDEQGVLRRFPSLAPVEQLIPVLMVDMECVTTAINSNSLSDCIARFVNLAPDTPVALDLEWRAAQKKGESSGKVSLMQLARLIKSPSYLLYYARAKYIYIHIIIFLIYKYVSYI